MNIKIWGVTVIKPPVGEKMKYAIKFEFLGSNNEANVALIL